LEYSEIINSEFGRLIKLYPEKKSELGQTGAEFVDAKEIEDTSSIKLKNLWGKFDYMKLSSTYVISNYYCY